MSLGPKLDLRQSQSLVMTPQLRQAIKLLHSSNLEVAAFVEEELERNPLLEREEGSVAVAAEAPAPDACRGWREVGCHAACGAHGGEPLPVRRERAEAEAHVPQASGSWPPRLR